MKKINIKMYTIGDYNLTQNLGQSGKKKIG